MAKILQQIQHDIREREEMVEGILEDIQLLAELDLEKADQFKVDVPRVQPTTTVSPGDIVMIDAGEGARRAYVVTNASKTGKVEITWLRSGKKHPAPIDVKDLKMASPSRFTRAESLAKANPGAVLEPGVGETKANIYNYTKTFNFLTI